MSVEILQITEDYIEKAYKEKNVHLLEKESMFVMNNIAFDLLGMYPNVLSSVKPIKVQFKKEPTLVFKEEYVTSLKNMLILSEKINQNSVEFTKAKLDFDSWFYEATSEGVLEFNYLNSSLLSITEAAEELNVSRSMIYKYIERGLETVGEKGSQKIPKLIVEAWKNPAFAMQMQWIHQVKKARTQTVEEKLEFVSKEIMEFEKDYQGTFHELYGHLSDHEIDKLDEAGDVFDWKKLENKKRELFGKLKGR